MQDLVERIEGWAKDKGIFRSSNGLAQATKTIKELGELASAIGDNDLNKIKNAIGDITVTLVIQAKMAGITIDLTPYTKEIEGLDKIKCLVTLSTVVCQWCSVWTTATNTYGRESMMSEAISFLGVMAQAYDLDYIDCVESAYTVISKRRGEMVNGMFVKEDG